jgi:predicted MFS family arabinose efflux permease
VKRPAGFKGFSTIKLGGIMTIDIITFVFAIGAVLWVVIPDIRKEVEEKANLFKDAIFGFPYIFKRRPLFYLLLLFLFVNLFAGFYTTLIAPMILAKTNNNTVFLGTVESAFGIGGIVGGLLMTAWGEQKEKYSALSLE